MKFKEGDIVNQVFNTTKGELRILCQIKEVHINSVTFTDGTTGMKSMLEKVNMANKVYSGVGNYHDPKNWKDKIDDNYSASVAPENRIRIPRKMKKKYKKNYRVGEWIKCYRNITINGGRFVFQRGMKQPPVPEWMKGFDI